MNGMVPPKGKNNIRATFYKSGGGKKGNQGIGIIDTLRKANPNIERVTNHFSSSGGEDGEDTEGAILCGPNTIKSRGFAVTAEDFEWLAREASPDVKKAKCFVDEKNNINIIIIVENKEGTHLPDRRLIDFIENYLKERVLFTIREKIRIYGPEYIRIDSEIIAKPLLLSESSIISEKIRTRLKTFFDPVKGGQDGKGYDLGQEIYLSEVAAVIESIDGVDYVEELILKKVIEDKVVKEVSGSGWISMEKNSVPYAGDIEIKIRD
jgi:predicted phage baseplate assembly protein